MQRGKNKTERDNIYAEIKHDGFTIFTIRVIIMDRLTDFKLGEN